MRFVCLCFLLAYGSFVAAEESQGLVWLGVNKAKCGGILIEPDVVLSAKSCIKDNFEVLWPFKSGVISPRYEYEEADLVVIFLERSWAKTTQLINTSELSNLKNGLHVYFTNKHHSAESWIDALEPLTITAFRGLNYPLVGSPMWSRWGVIGMMIDDQTALRLDPYFAFIALAIKAGRDRRPKAPTPSITANTTTAIVIEAQHVHIEPSLEPNVESSTQPVLQNPVETKPPESLGCRCSQVRRDSRGVGNRRFLEFVRRFFG